MPDDLPGGLVVDASVAAKVYFPEEGSELARRILSSATILLAPDLLFIEIVSVAAKRVRRGLSPVSDALNAVAGVRNLIDRAVPLAELIDRAFELAREHGFSAYDAAYLGLAEASGARLFTADMRMVLLARQTSLGDLVLPLAEDT